ncbi:hypothetical protein LJB87_01605 [Alistipes sp. OttesenSCG-928-L06]|nr:hypothetical protein [Alistipes sp. OttesenSCG-928-L06]
MAFEWNEIYADGLSEDGHIPQGYLDVQIALDRFVEINYDTASDAVRLHADNKDVDANHIRQQIVDIICNNPPLASVPKYLSDGRANYLWYSDFYDDAGREVFLQYRTLVASAAKITRTNYVTELAKMDLPYFKELVNLVSLEKLYTEAERRLAAAAKKAKPKKNAVKQVAADTATEVPQPASAVAQVPSREASIEQSKSKRSYEPKLNNEQYSILVKCIEAIEKMQECGK